MSDKMRWRYGDTNPVVAAVDAETQIEIGDLVWLDGDDAKPASALLTPAGAMSDRSEEGSLQRALVLRFLGVAMQRSRAGDPAPIRVATTGVFEFECYLATFELGDLIGGAENFVLTRLFSQHVGAVVDRTLAIGRACRRAPTATMSVLVDIRSTVMTGGI